MSRRLSILSAPINVKLNKSMVVNSFIGLAIALIFDDVKELFIREILLRVLNQKMKKKYIRIKSIGVIYNFINPIYLVCLQLFIISYYFLLVIFVILPFVFSKVNILYGLASNVYKTSSKSSPHFFFGKCS